ncbi:membrane protein DedA with SNARE-associated domain [Saccharomonospora amisosensis]|uniref:Membrane protein DedA with SNARE-associated domain n=1 Tax=Saccharomonospora amisosensis TaxID=1128677 RepID=A0A7X5ZNT1_9PSEU|nr:VTT domain-containing protein [Saccharomonospora amisosensis]NIJ10002.1 membrane protein DedA with SNARE-associated domain [Saccharomonospora amisosensis]
MDASTVSLLLLFGVAAVPFVPTEVALIGMGVAAAERDISLAPAVVVAVAGCLLCDYALYEVGRRAGTTVLARLSGRARVRVGVRWIEQHAGRRPMAVLVVARWLPAGGTVGSLLAGSLRWPRSVFLPASAIGVTLWSTYTATLGYLGGRLFTEPLLSFAASSLVALLLTVTVSTVVQPRSPGSA